MAAVLIFRSVVPPVSNLFHPLFATASWYPRATELPRIPVAMVVVVLMLSHRCVAAIRTARTRMQRRFGGRVFFRCEIDGFRSLSTPHHRSHLMDHTFQTQHQQHRCDGRDVTGQRRDPETSTPTWRPTWSKGGIPKDLESQGGDRDTI